MVKRKARTKVRTTTTWSARDPASSSPYYRRVAALYTRGIERDLARPYMQTKTPRNALAHAHALYSAGAPIDDVREALDRAAALYLQHLAQWRYRLESTMDPGSEIMVFAAAALVGRRRLTQLVAARRRCSFVEPPARGSEMLLWAFVEALKSGADARRLMRAQPAATGREPRYYRELATLLSTLSPRRPIGPALTRYLMKGWQPLAKKRLAYLRWREPVYEGPWDIVAAALCHVRREVPPIPATCLALVPVELVGSRRRGDART